MPRGRVSVIVVSYNHKRFLSGCVRAFRRAAPENARLILLDNSSTDGTPDFVRAELDPDVFIASDKNLGFAGGNNAAIELALADGDAYVYLLNPDTEAEPGFLEEAIRVMESDPKIGVVQSLLLLDDGKTINSWGNEIHFLGFGYAGGESVPLEEARRLGRLLVRDIAYASGAGMLVRAELLRQVGGLDEKLFAYHEDLEFSWRARLAGWRVVLAPRSVVRHKYEFSRSIRKFYWMERNRFLVLWKLAKLGTLALILPAMLLMEIGLWIFAFRSGWWKEKLRAYGHFLLPSTWASIARARHRMRHLRAISDRDATRLFTGRILFQQMNPALLTRVANPVFSAYWFLARLMLRW